MNVLTKLEARLRWFGYIQRKDNGYVGQKVLNVELLGRRKRGKTTEDVVEKIQTVGVTKSDVGDRVLWRLICCHDS